MAEDVKCGGGTVGVLPLGGVRRARPPRLADIPRHSAVDVVAEAKRERDVSKIWQPSDTDRLSAYSPDRSSLLRSHAAKSAECSGQGSPKARRTPRESRRVSLAQAPGYVQLNQYRLLEPIGQGSYGIVKLAYSEEDDTHYAMKILSKRKLMRRAGLFGRTPPRKTGPGPPSDPLQRVYREIAVLKKLDHPNVVKLVEVLDDPAEDQLYLVFQLLEGGPVIDVPTENPLSEETARKYFRDVVLGVEYLHFQRIAHRDIKPANLLMGEGRVQVADLGACGELAAAGRLSGAVGTPAFRAPEAVATTDKYNGEAADIWSLGVTLYAMVTGRVPWIGATSTDLQKRILAEPLTFPPRPPLSRSLKRFLARMLDKDPVTRATMKEIKEHEWLTLGGKEPLPSEEENCRLVEVTDEDMARVVTSIPNLSTLILIKTMLKKHSFQNPFLRSREGSARRESTDAGPGVATEESEREGEAAKADRATRRANLARSGRSLSAPGNYLTDKQQSFDISLESVQESKEVKSIKPAEQSSQNVPKAQTNSKPQEKESKENKPNGDRKENKGR
ncbi:calcium/calmodulin-dependent protein kinase kinase 1 isoform X1 [Maniola jurtina]|uniref:calcium/calmodulin-dependent protein kinase kinase 1 isoform X1 n=1 Tax=Maniola jurtina TaxID=191418 RepID=UPI001E687849|nr:calcium/calmodulin-dependent protein kinase kinase 1 isoform X1 [Maniola jurtina]